MTIRYRAWQAHSQKNKIDARRLVLNHIGARHATSLFLSPVSCPLINSSIPSRFPAPRSPGDLARNSIIRDIEKKASEARECDSCLGFMRVHVPVDEGLSGSALSNITREIESFRAGSTGRNQPALVTELVQINTMQQGRVDPPEEPSYNRNAKRRC